MPRVHDLGLGQEITEQRHWRFPVRNQEKTHEHHSLIFFIVSKRDGKDFQYNKQID
jgi:hypothetical protein